MNSDMEDNFESTITPSLCYSTPIINDGLGNGETLSKSIFGSVSPVPGNVTPASQAISLPNDDIYDDMDIIPPTQYQSTSSTSIANNKLGNQGLGCKPKFFEPRPSVPTKVASQAVSSPRNTRDQVIQGTLKQPKHSNRSNLTNDYDSAESVNDVILVQPSSSNETSNKKFLNNDILIAKSLQNSAFNVAGIISVNKNRSRNILVVKIKQCNDLCMTSILSIKQLGDYQVVCRLPANQAQSIGVIGPIGPDTLLIDIQSEVEKQGYGVDRVERITKGKDKTPTLSVKIIFNSNELPPHLNIGYQRFRVSVFVGTPWQCYRCQGFGHNAVHCRFKARCLICAGPHELRECKMKNNANRSAEVCCPNCKGKHTANYGGCYFFKEAKKVEWLRANNKISYRDAVKIRKQSTENNNNVNQSNLQSSLQSTNSTIRNSQPERNVPMTTSDVKYVTIATQTVSVEKEAQTGLGLESRQPEIDIIKGLATVISLLFENKKQTVTKENIIEVFNNTFDINLAQADISKPAHVPSVILESDASIEIQITHHSDDSHNSSQVNHISKNKKQKKNRFKWGL